MITLPPKQEAALIAYIVNFVFDCDKDSCWNTIADAIKQHGKPITKIVYRGHSANAPRIRNITPFFSVSPEIDVPLKFTEGILVDGKHVKTGNLFKIHLKRVLVIDTRDVNYTFSNDVIDELRKIVSNIPIQEGLGRKKYKTLDEYIPRLKRNIRALALDEDWREWIVLNGGTFYTDATMTEEGYVSKKRPEGYTLHEAWYSFL